MAEEPTELTVLLEVVEAIKLRLLSSSDSQMSNNERAQAVQIVNKFGAVHSFVLNSQQGDKEVIMGDHYTTGQAGAVGPGSTAHDINFTQVWNQASSSIELPALAGELSTLKVAMRDRATQPEEHSALAEVAHAQVAAENGDGPAAMSSLSRAGKWAMGIANSVGVQVAAAAIKSALGI
jgi:hypothetical protein